MKLLVLSMLGMCLCISSIQAVQMIETGPDPRMEAWSKFGENLGKSIGQGIRKNLEEQERINNIKNEIFIDEILNSWTPEQHVEYVTRVQNSNLPEDLKLLVLYELKIKSRNHQ